MNEMKTLTLNGVTYDSFNDQNAVRFSEQTLTEEQKAQARENIGAVSAVDIVNVVNIKEKYNLDDAGGSDCSNYINQAIAEAAAGDTLYLPLGKYKVDSTITVNKKINLKILI